MMNNYGNNNTTTTKRRLKIISKLFRSKKGRSKIKDEEEKSLHEKLNVNANVNEEYKEIFRTKSFVDLLTNIKSPLLSSLFSSLSPSSTSSSFSVSSRNRPVKRLTNCLLEPRQEVVLESIKSIKSAKLKGILKDYFNVTLEAHYVCELLLRAIHKTRANHRVMERVIMLSTNGYTGKMVIKEFSSFANQSNPFDLIANGAVDFRVIHQGHALLLEKLASRGRKIKRREKFIKYFKKFASYGFIIGYTILAIALLAVALHSVVGLLGVPGVLLPFSTCVLKKFCLRKLKPSSMLERLGAQVDITAKGLYILVNDFDTMGRLVSRVHDEIEHRKAVSEMCVRNSKSRELVKEAIKEVCMRDGVFVEQIDELEEHVCLCFLTINRFRKLVFREILG